MIKDLTESCKKTVADCLVRFLPKQKKALRPESIPRQAPPKSAELLSPSYVNRFELKYFISESQAAVIKKLIKPYTQPDPYCLNQPGGAYPLASLYLDSPDLRLCRESLEGHKNRFKLRIRRYSDDLSSPSFFEIKRRVDRVIIKSRVKIEDNKNIEKLLFAPSSAIQKP